MLSKDDVYALLEQKKIPYEKYVHPAVYTIEEMEKAGVSEKGLVVKNLFLRDAKGKRHFLVTLHKDKKADLKELQTQLGCTKLSFASEERLEKYLGLKKGAVTPLGILNDEEQAVEVVFDEDLTGEPKLGVHPNDNTATVFLSFENLKALIQEHGNDITFVRI